MEKYPICITIKIGDEEITLTKTCESVVESATHKETERNTSFDYENVGRTRHISLIIEELIDFEVKSDTPQ